MFLGAIGNNLVTASRFPRVKNWVNYPFQTKLTHDFANEQRLLPSMKLSAFFVRRSPWINLPGAILMMLLQRTPVLNVVAAVDEMVIASPVGTVLKSALATVAALGAVNTLVGASALTVSAGTSTGITVVVGSPLSVSFSLPGSDNAFDPTAKWTLAIAAGSSFPPGLSFSGLTAAGTANVKFPQLSGTPTTAGVYNLTLRAISADNVFSSPIYAYAVTVTGTANTAPSITTQPTGQTVTAGAMVTFTATADGTPTPTYQWQKGGVNIPGATSTTYTIVSTVTGDAGIYTVVATNSVSSATSNGATLTVNAAPVAPSINSQPADQTVTAGQSASFSVGADGTAPLSYQWRKNTVNIPGATGSTYTIASTAGGDAGTYTVVVSNAVSNVTSNGATLTVNAAPAAPAITTQPLAQSVNAGSPVTFVAAASGNPVPTYQWQKNGVNIGGATNSSYTIAVAVGGDSGNYAVIATNSVSSATSNSVLLSVIVPPSNAIVTITVE